MGKFFMKNGEFSKTAVFATVANVLVTTAYAMSMFQGTTILGVTFTAFDAQAALAFLGIANGTYVVNHNWNKAVAK